MKFVKRITALFLAMVMVMAMGITASAYTITAPTSGGHTYEVYQIFTATLTTKDGVDTLSDIKWGENGTGTKGEKVADATITAIQAVTGTDQQKATALSAYVNFNTTPVATLTNGQTYTAEAGYYLIKDKDNTVPSGDSATTYLVKVVNDLTIAPKSSAVPSFEKKIADINDSTEAAKELTTRTDWQDSADYDIGDQVPFKLTATLPSNYADYTSYYLQFKDQMEAGLTFNASSVVVKVGDTTLTKDTDYTIATSTSVYDSKSGSVKSGTGFTVTINDLKKTTGKDSASAGGKVTVYYTAQLNQNAVLGNTGNVNEAKLIYSNNPNWTGDGDKGPHGETPWDNVIVFTYKVVVNKVEPNGTDAQGKTQYKPLAKAAFKLEKEIKGTDGGENTWSLVKEFELGDGTATSFTFTGLDDGNYRLTETQTPAGYNTISPITFTVSATHNIEWTTGNRTDVLTQLTGNAASGEITFTTAEDKSGVSTNVVNQKGSNLPSTGGMGTTVLYVAGIALIVVAGVVVIARKRNA